MFHPTGFTLFEFVIAVALLLSILAAVGPFTARTYLGLLTSSDASLLVTLLRRAETFAFTHRNAESYGVAVQGNALILFQGSSYAARNADFDEAHTLAPSVTVSGPAEVVFSAVSGKPNAGGTWVVSNGADSRTVILNDYGMVAW